MKKYSYEHLVEVLNNQCLIITDMVYERTSEGQYTFKGSIKARIHTDAPHVKDDAMYRSIFVKADSPDGVMEKLWHIIRNKEIWIGQPDNCHKVLKWNSDKEKLIERELSKQEKLAQEISRIA